MQNEQLPPCLYITLAGIVLPLSLLIVFWYIGMFNRLTGVPNGIYALVLLVAASLALATFAIVVYWLRR